MRSQSRKMSSTWALTSSRTPRQNASSASGRRTTLLRRSREDQRERRAHADPAFHLDIATHQAGEIESDGETDADAPTSFGELRWINLHERTKDGRQAVRWNPSPGISYPEAYHHI